MTRDSGPNIAYGMSGIEDLENVPRRSFVFVSPEDISLKDEPPKGQYIMALENNEVLDQQVKDLAAQTHMSVNDVLTKGIALLTIALKADQQGFGLGVVDKGNVVADIVGISTNNGNGNGKHQ